MSCFDLSTCLQEQLVTRDNLVQANYLFSVTNSRKNKQYQNFCKGIASVITTYHTQKGILCFNPWLNLATGTKIGRQTCIKQDLNLRYACSMTSIVPVVRYASTCQFSAHKNTHIYIYLQEQQRFESENLPSATTKRVKQIE